ncbi:hypothetical protein MMC25_003843 [Agyrium rufum]|nr:hypothetical protein [Agyrium rufum]
MAKLGAGESVTFECSTSGGMSNLVTLSFGPAEGTGPINEPTGITGVSEVSSDILERVFKLPQELKDLILNEILVCHLVRGKVFPRDHVDPRLPYQQPINRFASGISAQVAYDPPNLCLMEILLSGRLKAKAQYFLYGFEYQLTWQDILYAVDDLETYTQRAKAEAGMDDVDEDDILYEWREDLENWTTDVVKWWERKFRASNRLNLKNVCIDLGITGYRGGIDLALRLLRRCVRRKAFKLLPNLHMILPEQQWRSNRDAYANLIKQLVPF